MGKKKQQEVNGKPRGSSALCMGLQAQDTFQVAEHWTRSVCFGCHPSCLCRQLSRLFLEGFIIARDPHQEAAEPR